jgi:predicted patatin/cPLA2 family phospholipase
MTLESENSRLRHRIEKYKDVLGQMEKQQDDKDAEHVQATKHLSLVIVNHPMTCAGTLEQSMGSGD